MRFKLYYLPFILLVLSSLSKQAWAQKTFKLTGKITDDSNGEDMIGAIVVEASLMKGAASNTFGFYSLTLPAGKHEIVVSFMGYNEKKLNVDLYKDESLNIELSLQSEVLDEVVITTDRAGDKAFSPQIGMQKMQSSTIKKLPVVMGESDILKSIQLLPGITDGGEGTGGMYIRGGSSDQNLVLLDGASMYNSSHLFGFISTFNTDAINDIQIYKGGIPAKYGGRLSGVLDVTQKEGNNKKYAINGGIGTLSSRLMIEGPINKGKGSFLVAGRRSYADLFLRLAQQTDNILYFYDLNMKANYELNASNRLFVSGYFGSDVMGAQEINFSTAWGNKGATVRWIHVLNPKLFGNASYIYSDYDFSLGIDAITWNTGIVTNNVKYDLSYYEDQFKIYAGVDAKHYNFNPGVFGEQRIQPEYAYALDGYLSVSQDLTKRLSINYGLRWSSFYRVGPQDQAQYLNDAPLIYDQTLGIYIPQSPIGITSYGDNDKMAGYNNFEPRFSGVYKMSNSSIKVGYDRMTQYIHLVSNTNAPTPYDTWIPSGRYFKPMTSDQISGGYFRNLKGSDYEFSIEGFYKNINNMVDYIDGADLIGNPYVETQVLSGKARAYGLEFMLRKNVGKFTGWISYTLSKTERQIPGLGEDDPGINNGEYYPSTYDRPNDLSITGIYSMSNSWTFSGNFIYQTGRPTTYMKGYYIYDNQFVPNYEDRNRQRMPAYHRMDASATYTPKKNKVRRLQMEYIFSIYNLYNRHNASTMSFDMNKDTGAIEAQKTWIFGIIPSITVNFKW